jgi:hypothetical protein
LIKKLSDPLYLLLNDTSAVSLSYEIISTCITAILTEESLDSKLGCLCIAKLQSFIIHSDVNLKYLGLIALNSLIDIKPSIASGYREIVLSSIQDKDITLRYRALDIIIKMVNQENVVAIFNKLVSIIDAEAESSSVVFRDYAEHVAQSIIHVASRDIYGLVEREMEWFVEMLARLSKYAGVGEYVIDVCVRVVKLRVLAVKLMVDELVKGVEGIVDVREIVWLIGEYSVEDGVADTVVILLKICIDGKREDAIGACIDALTKLCVRFPSSGDAEAVISGLERILDQSSNLDIQAQEQANVGIAILQGFLEMNDSGVGLYTGELLPVSIHAQHNVHDCLLDLDAWINSDLAAPVPVVSVAFLMVYSNEIL